MLHTPVGPSNFDAEHGLEMPRDFPEVDEKWTCLASCPLPQRGSCQPLSGKSGPRKNTVGLYSVHNKKEDLEDC